MQKKRTVIIPSYMKNFHCIASQCEDSCCIGWNVDIDEDTYGKYRKCPNFELKSKLEEMVKRNRSNPTSNSYARIKLDKNKYCPFLDEDKLCELQRGLGWEYLSNTCKTYPRVFNDINGVLEKSATMSCPEVVRQLLLEVEGIDFVEIEEEFTYDSVLKYKWNTDSIAFINKPQRYLWELRVFTIQVLKSRDYGLWERLIILGLFYDKLNRLIQDGKLTEISALIDSYTSMIVQGVFKEELVNIPANIAVQMELLKELTDERVVKGVNSKRYLECFMELLQGIDYRDDLKVEEIAANYLEAYQKYYQPFMLEKDHILENYLVNYVFKNLFPCDKQKNVFDSYIMLILHYALIKMHLIGMAGFHKENFNDELVVKLIQSFAKTVEHNHIFLQHLLDLIKANKFDTMPYMAILIKN